MNELLPSIHPGTVLRDDFLEPWRMTPYRLAQGLGMSQTAMGEILSGTRGITALTALHLSRFLGTTPEFWLNLQRSYDLEVASRAHGDRLDRIVRYEHRGPVLVDGNCLSPPGNPLAATAEHRCRRGSSGP